MQVCHGDYIYPEYIVAYTRKVVGRDGKPLPAEAIPPMIAATGARRIGSMRSSNLMATEGVGVQARLSTRPPDGLHEEK